MLVILLCISGLFSVFVPSPIEAVLYLILTFCISAFVLFMMQSEFLGFVFIMVYVGAIAVLFLFVVMMLDIRLKEEGTFLNVIKRYYYILIPGFYAFILFLYIFFDGVLMHSLEDANFKAHHIALADDLHIVNLLGQLLFDEYLIPFLLAGMVLLVALVTAVALTSKKTYRTKPQNLSHQLARSDNVVSFYKKG